MNDISTACLMVRRHVRGEPGLRGRRAGRRGIRRTLRGSPPQGEGGDDQEHDAPGDRQADGGRRTAEL
ncbi:hypothetical protein ACFVH9_02385 [Streptomyces hirsutus]|uniref:hypothetical protein n=1 Tax=Streptomyces hirsutus TaxID=35620 RepID=UPI0036255B37